MASPLNLVGLGGGQIPDVIELDHPQNSIDVASTLAASETNVVARLASECDVHDWGLISGFAGKADAFFDVRSINGYRPVVEYDGKIVAPKCDKYREDAEAIRRKGSERMTLEMNALQESAAKDLGALRAAFNPLAATFLESIGFWLKPSAGAVAIGILMHEAWEKWSVEDLLSAGRALAGTEAWTLVAPIYRRWRESPPTWAKGYNSHLDSLLTAPGSDALQLRNRVYTDAIRTVNLNSGMIRARIIQTVESLV